MRVILIVVVILVLLAIGGYLTVIRDNDRTSINFETEKLKQDSKSLVEKTKHEWKDTREKGKKLLEDPDEKPAPAYPVNP